MICITYSVCALQLQIPHSNLQTHIYKKFELMLTKRAKAYSSSCSQIALVSLSPAISSQFTLEVSGAAENCKNMKPFISGVQGFSKSSMLI